MHPTLPVGSIRSEALVCQKIIICAWRFSEGTEDQETCSATREEFVGKLCTMIIYTHTTNVQSKAPMNGYNV